MSGFHDLDQVHGDKAQAVLESYRHLFSSPLATLVLADLGALCHETETTFDSDPRVSAFKEGQRSVLLWILYLARSKPVTKKEAKDE